MVRVAPRVCVLPTADANVPALSEQGAVVVAAVGTDVGTLGAVDCTAPFKAFKVKVNLSVTGYNSSDIDRAAPFEMGIYKKTYKMSDVENINQWQTDQQFRRACIWYTRGIFASEFSMSERRRFSIKIPKHMRTFNIGDKLIFKFKTGSGQGAYCFTSVVNCYK